MRILKCWSVKWQEGSISKQRTQQRSEITFCFLPLKPKCWKRSNYLQLAVLTNWGEEGEKRRGWSTPRFTLSVCFIRHFSESSCCCDGPGAKSCQLSIPALPGSARPRWQLSLWRCDRNGHRVRHCLQRTHRRQLQPPSPAQDPPLWLMNMIRDTQLTRSELLAFPEWWSCSWRSSDKTRAALDMDII